jgi:hypothetical protein
MIDAELLFISRWNERMERIDGHTRVRYELRRVAHDIVGRCEHDELDLETKRYLGDVMSRAAERAERTASEALVTELAHLLSNAPNDLIMRLETAEVRRSLGFE